MILLFAFLCSYASASPATFAPPNDLYVSEVSDTQANIAQKAQFDRAISLVYNAYANEVARAGAVLRINNLWSDGTVNAQAYRRGNVWHIDAFGGLARFGQMDVAGFVGVLCHELGHHKGGRPRYFGNTDWASVEGQSDFWGFRNCMTRVLPSEAFRSAQILANTLARINGEPNPKESTPSRVKVSQTMEGHPPAQCRLDTYFAALRGKPRPECWYKS